MIHQGSYNQMADSRWGFLYKLSGAAALIAGLLLLIAMIGLAITVFNPNTIHGVLTPLENNWLVVIFKLHAGFDDVSIDLLQGLNVLDFAILSLAGVMYLGLFAALYRTSKILSILALVQPFLGLILFITTKTAGRSTVMGAGLVISIAMLRNKIFSKATIWIGIVASVLLLIGDFSAGIPPSTIMVALFGIGYLLLLTWFFLMARRLFQLKP